MKLTAEQKCDIAQRELEELRDEIEKLKDESEKILDNFRVGQQIVLIKLKENFDKDGNYQGTSMQINCKDKYLEKAEELDRFFINAFYKNKWGLNKNIPINNISSISNRGTNVDANQRTHKNFSVCSKNFSVHTKNFSVRNI